MRQLLIGRRLGMTTKAVRRTVEQRLEVAGSTLSTVIALRILSERPDLSQRELADDMDIEGPTLVRHLDRMEAAGLVTRTRDTGDRRIQRVRLTPEGDSQRARLARVAQGVDRELKSVFTTQELAAFEEYLDRLADHARQLSEEVAP